MLLNGNMVAKMTIWALVWAASAPGLAGDMQDQNSDTCLDSLTTVNAVSSVNSVNMIKQNKTDWLSERTLQEHEKTAKQLGWLPYCCNLRESFDDAGNLRSRERICDAQCVSSMRLSEERQRQDGGRNINNGIGAVLGAIFGTVLLK